MLFSENYTNRFARGLVSVCQGHSEFPFDISLVLRRRRRNKFKFFSSSTEAFSITQWICTSIGSYSAVATAASQISSLQWWKPFLADAEIRSWNASAAGLDLLQLKEQILVWRCCKCCHCKACKAPLHTDDGHAECVSCLGKSHAVLLFQKATSPLLPPILFLPGTSMPVSLAITAGRAFACPLHSTWSASLRGCERHDLVRWEWRRDGWQPFSGGFGRGRVIGARPCHDNGSHWAQARVVSA